MSMILYLRRATSEDVARLDGDADWLDVFMFENSEGDRTIDFDKAWHALYFMLTGDAGPSSSSFAALLGNDEELRGTDIHFYGYWVIDPHKVLALDQALSGLSDQDIAARYDPDAFAEHSLYSSDIFTEEGDRALPYVMRGIPALRALTRAAAGAGDYIIGSIF